MTSPSSALLDPVAASRKRRFSALEFLSLQPTPSEHPKRPRILIVDDDGPSKASPDLPQGSTKTLEAIASSGGSDASSDVESTSTSGSSESTSESAADGDPPRSSDIDEDAAASDEGGSTSSSSSSSSSDADESQYLGTPTPGTSFGKASSRHERRKLRSTSSSRSRSNEKSEALQSRLKSFLPQLRAANVELETARQAGTLRKRTMELKDGGEAAEDADDESTGAESPQYIEMNLGLGVLEQKREGSAASSSSSSSASSDTGEAEEDTANEQGEEEAPKPREKQVLRKLMGQGKAEKPEIRVVNDA